MLTLTVSNVKRLVVFKLHLKVLESLADLQLYMTLSSRQKSTKAKGLFLTMLATSDDTRYTQEILE